STAMGAHTIAQVSPMPSAPRMRLSHLVIAYLRLRTRRSAADRRSRHAYGNATLFRKVWRECSLRLPTHAREPANGLPCGSTLSTAPATTSRSALGRYGSPTEKPETAH